MNENYWCFLCLPAINIVYVLDFRHSNRYVAISCSFSCKLHSNKWCWSSSHMFIFHMCIFCPEMSIQVFLTFSSDQFRCSVMSDSLQCHGLQYARPPCPSPTPGAYSDSCPLSQWCHPTISSSVGPFSSCMSWSQILRSLSLTWPWKYSPETQLGVCIFQH